MSDETATTRTSRRKFLTGAAAVGGAATVAAGTGVLPAQGLLGLKLPIKPLLPLLPVIPGLTDPGGLLSQLGQITDPTTAALGLTINPPQPPTPTVINADVLHRLRRWTYGPTPALISQVTTPAKASTYLDQQLNPNAVNDSVCDAVLAQFPSNKMNGQQVRANYNNSNLYKLMYEACAIKLMRTMHSNRQLQERMTEFWMDHFNVNAGDRFMVHRQHMENAVVRPNALGKFSDLLVGVTRHPAMLLYLDAALSTKEHPNQNFARESLELYTIGAGGGFGESDVWESSRLLTGMTVQNDTYQYVQSLHDTNQVTILGKTYGPNSNEATIVQYLNDLARHPSTARRVTARLCVYFVKDVPSDALIDSATAVYLQNDTAIAPVLRHIFNHAEFNSAANQKLHRPLEMLIATIRAAGITQNLSSAGAITGLIAGALPGNTGLVPGTDTTQFLATLAPDADLSAVTNLALLDPVAALANNLNGGSSPIGRLASLMMSTGQHPGGWGPPNGYPLVGGAYINSAAFYRRINAVMLVTAGQVPQLPTNYAGLFGFPSSMSRQETFDRIFRAFTFRSPTANERTTLSGNTADGHSLNATQLDQYARTWAPIVAALPETHLR